MENYIFYIEIIGTIAFAISGAMEAIKNKLDLLGVVILGVVTATGGGLIRDLIIGVTPPLSFRDGRNIYISIVASLLVFFYSLFNENINNRTINKIYGDSLIYFDAVGLGAFTITSMQMAYLVNSNYSAILYIFIGFISGVGGGIIRDLLINNVPYILRKHVYASATIIGAIVYHFSRYYSSISEAILIPFSIGIIILIRIMAYHYKWNLPKATRILD